MAKEWVISEEDLGCDGAYLSYNEVIRCKDCKLCETGLPFLFCKLNNHSVSEKDFCSWAKRRTE